MNMDDRKRAEQKKMIDRVFSIKDDKFNRQLSVLTQELTELQQNHHSTQQEIKNLEGKLAYDREETYAKLSKDSAGLSRELADLEERRQARFSMIDELKQQLIQLEKSIQEKSQERAEKSREQQKNQVKKEILDEEL